MSTDAALPALGVSLPRHALSSRLITGSIDSSTLDMNTCCNVIRALATKACLVDEYIRWLRSMLGHALPMHCPHRARKHCPQTFVLSHVPWLAALAQTPVQPGHLTTLLERPVSTYNTGIANPGHIYTNRSGCYLFWTGTYLIRQKSTNHQQTPCYGISQWPGNSMQRLPTCLNAQNCLNCALRPGSLTVLHRINCK